MDHDTGAICLCNVATLRNKKSALCDISTALCDMTVYYIIRVHYVIWVRYAICGCTLWNGCATIVSLFHMGELY